MNRIALYFSLAALPSLLGGEHQPTSAWEWARLIGMSIYQGLLAVKALQSPQPLSPSPSTLPTSPTP